MSSTTSRATPARSHGVFRAVAAVSAGGVVLLATIAAERSLGQDAVAAGFGPALITLDGQPAPPPSAASCGFALIAGHTGPQLAWTEPAGMVTVCAGRGEDVRVEVPVHNVQAARQIRAEVSVAGEGRAEVALETGAAAERRMLEAGQVAVLRTPALGAGADWTVALCTRGVDGQPGVRWRRLRYLQDGRWFDLPLRLQAPALRYPPPALPDMRPAIQRELIEWDWRMQDGIGTAREPRGWSAAVQAVFQRGDRLIEQLAGSDVPIDDLLAEWETVRGQWQAARTAGTTADSVWEDLWRRVHRLRRRIALRNPLADLGPVAFVKRVPSCFSHQLTQYSGMCARPGGGVFVLDAPGRQMQCRRLETLPDGAYQHLDVSWDGRRVLFSFCRAEEAPADWRTCGDRHYHLFEVTADGDGLRQLTDGPYDDFAPRYLPDGKILFLSTRRGGYHRCGRGPCPVYTMAVADADGTQVRVISFHETHEWDPAVLNDGRVIYTRWDYVDRHAVHYQQLWTVRPDGTDVRAYYGNNTFNPVGVWEARPVPGSNVVMATAGAHHAMTAGSIVLIDTRRGVDGLRPITRLTTDALFPESESRVQRWRAPAGVRLAPPVPVPQRRWPCHCYRSPYPLSKDFFLAAYSFDALIGEPAANPANMFGIYLVDRFGNKELLYRDPGISSLWPMPLRPRRRSPVLPSTRADATGGEGTFLLQDVYASWPDLAAAGETIAQLRILQVLPKTTPNINAPRVGLANASPGKQVLGTVPVEPDGSAYFRAPARIPLAFQALDRRGMAVQTMRSLTYLQPGEQAGCVGCHEHRTRAVSPRAMPLAAQRPPSVITPGPDGSRPFSYPILVQPVLDRHCVACHHGPEPGGGVDLTGRLEAGFTASYCALAPRVPYSEWKSTPAANAEPLTPLGRFGARASKLTSLLLEGHQGVKLGPADLERLVTWMDTNALFFGTFDPQDQNRQQRGQRIAGPALQ